MLFATVPILSLEAQVIAWGYEMKEENCHNPNNPDAVQERCRPAENDKSCNASEQTSCPK